MKIGFAKDIHNLEHKQLKPLILGGYKIDNQDLSILATSDGDIVLHSITSALLGALGMDTMGEYFPDTSHDNINRSSIDFVKFALGELKERQMQIISLDICIVCEQIMFKQYLKDIKQSLKNILMIEDIGIKCTRFEDKQNFQIESYCSLIIDNFLN